jgi:hypothetical protein
MPSYDVFAVELAMFFAQMLQMDAVEVLFSGIFYGEGFAAFRAHVRVLIHRYYVGVVARCVVWFTGKFLIWS